jgi:hypothetical protein
MNLTSSTRRAAGLASVCLATALIACGGPASPSASPPSREAPVAERNTTPAPAPTPIVEQDGPFLYEVTIDGATSWLFGVAWIGHQEIPALAADYVAEAQRFVFEYDVDTARLAPDGGEPETEQSLRYDLGEQGWSELREWLPYNDATSLDASSPNAVSTSLVGLGSYSSSSMMAHIISGARADDKAVSFMVDDRGAYEDEWVALSLEKLQRALEDVRAATTSHLALYSAYRNGDADAVVDTFSSRASGEAALYRHYNDVFAERLHHEMSQSGTLAVVTVVHVLGPDGIIEQLRARGATITRLGGGTPATVPLPGAHLSDAECDELYMALSYSQAQAAGLPIAAIDAVMNSEMGEWTMEKFRPICRTLNDGGRQCMASATSADDVGTCMVTAIMSQ